MCDVVWWKRVRERDRRGLVRIIQPVHRCLDSHERLGEQVLPVRAEFGQGDLKNPELILIATAGSGVGCMLDDFPNADHIRLGIFFSNRQAQETKCIKSAKSQKR